MSGKINPDNLITQMVPMEPCEHCSVKLGIYENLGSGPEYLCRTCARELTGDPDFGTFGTKHQMVYNTVFTINVNKEKE